MWRNFDLDGCKHGGCYGIPGLSGYEVVSGYINGRKSGMDMFIFTNCLAVSFSHLPYVFELHYKLIIFLRRRLISDV